MGGPGTAKTSIILSVLAKQVRVRVRDRVRVRARVT